MANGGGVCRRKSIKERGETMEAFKEYLKKEYPHIDTGDEMFAWDIWRAALEWFHKKLGDSTDHETLKYIIENELNDPQELRGS